MPANIAIITYSMYGHVDTLADSVEAGVKSTGATVTRLQIAESLPQEVLTKMSAPAKRDIRVISNVHELKDYDGFLFGFPTRYGARPAQVSAFFDKTGGLWLSGGLVGKFAGIFTSTASQHGGQETTALTTIPFLAHQGVAFVPIGYALSHLTDNSEVLGGSAYGAGTIAGGDGSRKPSPKELEIAEYQGKFFSGIVNAYVAGKAKTTASANASAPAQAISDTVGATVGDGIERQKLADGNISYAPKSTEAAAATLAPETKPEAEKKVKDPKEEENKGLFAKWISCCSGGKRNHLS